MGLDSPTPRSWIPYSVSMPQTLRMATDRTYRLIVPNETAVRRARWLEVLAGAHTLDGPATSGLLAVIGVQRPDVDDPLTLLAGDLRPVVGVGGVGQVLVLLVLLL